MPRPLAPCMYCGRPSTSREHVIATRFINVMREDPRGLVMPLVLGITLPGGERRRIGGKRTKRGHYTLEYVTRVCDQCNSGWMNDVDSAAFPYVAELIRGHALGLDTTAQTAIAAWMCKVAVTARAVPWFPLPIEKSWTDWLYSQHSALPSWCVWVGRHIGSIPWWYNPHDISIELHPDSPGPSDSRFIRKTGVVATLVMGYLVVQIYGTSSEGALNLMDSEPQILPMIWPVQNPIVIWPAARSIDDAGLPVWAERLLYKPGTPLPKLPI